jgi:DNA-binding GntR family transcriptional regulator
VDKKQAVYESLRFRIINNDLRPGEPLNEKQLMARYKIGRTPLREIFLHLQRDKLIQMIPRLGTLVTTMELREVREIIDIRKALEALVAQLAVQHIEAAQIHCIREISEKIRELEKTRPPDTLERLTRLDLDFHSILYDSTRNRRLKEILLEQQSLMARFWFQLGIGEEDFFGQMTALDTIVRGLEEGDVVRVQKALEDHIRLYITKVREEIL